MFVLGSTFQNKDDFEKIVHIGDSECTLALLRKDSTSLKEFMGNRVAECLEGSEETDWWHVPTNLNIADLGTRRLAQIQDLGPDSCWQRGPHFLSLPQEEWPITRDLNTPNIPRDEVKTKKVTVAAVQTAPPLFDLNRLGRNFEFCVRTVSRVLKVFKAKSFKEGITQDITAQDLNEAETLLIKRSQVEVKKMFDRGVLKNLRPFVSNDGLIMVGGRAEFSVPHLGAPALPVLDRKDKLAYLFTVKMHEEDHSGVSSTAARVRSKYWIVGGRRLADNVRSSCVKCRKHDKKLCEQQMAPLVPSRLMVAPPFMTTSLDLAGPFEVRDQVKKRTTMKVWLVVFTCTATRAIDLEVAPAYNEDSFILSYKKFTNRRGPPAEVISDQGTQLVAAAKDVAVQPDSRSWNWQKIKDSTKKGTIWTFVDKEGQHQNGVSESMVKLTKKSLALIMGNAKFTYAEFELAVSEVAYSINNRPLGLSPDSTDEVLEPLTANHLLLGRSGREIPPDEDKGKASLTTRYRYVQTVLDDWWKRWVELLFPTLVPSHKWLQRHRNVQKGDICLIKYASIRATYKLGRVTEVFKSEADGLVRRVKVSYKNKDSNAWKEIERPIQTIAIIVPVEEQ